MEYVFYYKIICIISGLLIIFLGYKLFLKGIFTESGDIEGSWKDTKLIVKKAAPGTYFVLFGSIIIAMVVFKGLNNEEISSKSNSFNHSTQLQNQPSLKLDDSIKIK